MSHGGRHDYLTMPQAYICRHCVRYSIIFTCVWCVSDRLLLPLRECFSKWCTESMCEQLNIPAEHECFCQSSLELEQAVICWDFLSSWQTNHSMWCSELTNCLLYYIAFLHQLLNIIYAPFTLAMNIDTSFVSLSVLILCDWTPRIPVHHVDRYWMALLCWIRI